MKAVPEDSGFTIRPAVEEDVPRLMGLIWDLAVYEKLTHEVVATEESLRASLFGEAPAAEVAEARSKSNLPGDSTAWTVPRP